VEIPEGATAWMKESRRDTGRAAAGGQFPHKPIDVPVIGLTAVIAGRIERRRIGEQEADKALPVKENRPTVYREIRAYFEGVEEGWGRNPPAEVRRSGLEKKRFSYGSKKIFLRI
jgi:hypothetical protein